MVLPEEAPTTATPCRWAAGSCRLELPWGWFFSPGGGVYVIFHLLGFEEEQRHGWRLLPCWAEVQAWEGVARAVPGVMLRTVDATALQEHGL